ncbi:hypothetical protein REPUB_Repub04eG0046100 [Reevesia pubescens]
MKVGVGLDVKLYCYDPLDPNGNITVTFDINQWTQDGYVARVTIQNYYQYRHVDKSGWKLGWTWANKEIIWSMSGAFATTQGNCSLFKYQTPHCCQTSPVIADHMPDALPVNRTDDCCHGGLLAAWAINPSKSFSAFEMMVGNLGANSSVQPPLNLTLMAPGPGYTCGLVEDTDPTVSSDVGGKRQLQAYRTWKSTCTYSSFVANQAPVCCVSLSTFYNPKVTSCPDCSCGCREADKNTVSCITEDDDIVQCTDHMCPVRALQPDLIINAGTAGGFKGAVISDVFLVSHVAFHDRRIPTPVFDLYGVGLRQAFATPNLLKALNMKGAAVCG